MSTDYISVDIVTTDAGGRWLCDVASTDTDRQVGLQAYPQLGNDHGLIFTWDGEAGDVRAFHQGNVPYAIRIVWVVDGAITKVVDSRPGEMSKHQGRADWVLEVALGDGGDGADQSDEGNNVQSLREGAAIHRESANGALSNETPNADAAKSGKRMASWRTAATYDPPVIDDLPQLISTLVATIAANPTLIQWRADTLNAGRSKSFVITRAFLRQLCHVARMENELDVDIVVRAVMQPEVLQTFADALVGNGVADLVKAPESGLGLVLYKF